LYEESDLNPLTKMWHKVSKSPLLNHKLSEFIKLVEIVVVQVFGSIRHECTFNNVPSWRLNYGIDLAHT
jgi:hypothetical protein